MDVHDIRMQARQARSAGGDDRTFLILLVLILSPPLASGAWWATTSASAALAASEAEQAREKSSFRAADVKPKGEPNIVADWVQFNRGKKDGDSAEDFVYANCMMASAYVNSMRGAGADPYKGVQDTLDGGALSAEQKRKAERYAAMTPEQRKAARAKEREAQKKSCRESSKGYTWEKY